MSSPVRTTSGLNSHFLPFAGYLGLDGDAGDMQAVAQTQIDAAAAVGPSYIATLPPARDLFGRGNMLVHVIPGPNTVTMEPQAGESVEGSPDFNTEVLVWLCAEDRTTIRISPPLTV